MKWMRGFIRKIFWKTSSWYKGGWRKDEMTEAYWTGN